MPILANPHFVGRTLLAITLFGLPNLSWAPTPLPMDDDDRPMTRPIPAMVRWYVAAPTAYCVALTRRVDGTHCRNGVCIDQGSPTLHMCGNDDIARAADKYTAIRSELGALSIKGLRSDIDHGFPRQVVVFASYIELLSQFNPRASSGEVAGVRLASRFRDPARAYVLLAKLYLTVPGANWPTMNTPIRPGVHSDWDVAILSTRRRFGADEIKSIATRFMRNISEEVLDTGIAPYLGQTDEFKEVFSEFMVLANADRVITLQPAQLEQYRHHLQYLGSHEYYLPLRTARWFYEAVVTSGTAQDLFPYNDVPTSGFVGLTIANSAQLPGPYKAIELNRIDVDWDRNVTVAEFDAMVAAYWNKPRAGYPVSGRVIIVQTLNEIRAFIGFGPGGIRSVIPAEWVPLADAFRRTLNSSSSSDDVIGLRPRCLSDDTRFINAVYRVLAMLDTPRDSPDHNDAETHSVTAAKVMKLIGGDEAVMKERREYLSLIRPEPCLACGPDEAGRPSIRMMFEVTLSVRNFIWQFLGLPFAGSHPVFNRARDPPRGYPIYGLEGMADSHNPLRGSLDSYYPRFTQFLKGTADPIGRRGIIGIIREYRKSLGLNDNEMWTRHSSYYQRTLHSGPSPAAYAGILAAERAVIQADTEARHNDTLLATRFYPRIHLLFLLKYRGGETFGAIVESLMNRPDSEIAGIAEAVGYYRSVALMAVSNGSSAFRWSTTQVLDYMGDSIEQMVNSGIHGEGIIDDDLMLVVLGRIAKLMRNVHGASDAQGRAIVDQIGELRWTWIGIYESRHTKRGNIQPGLIRFSESLASLIGD